VPAATNPSFTSTRLRNIFGRVGIPPLVHITAVQVIGDHELRLAFEDGTVGDVAFGDEEWTGVFEPLQDPARFANVAIEAGTIVWPEDGLDMAPEPLYQDALKRQVSRQR
jgi:hypothetical protein